MCLKLTFSGAGKAAILRSANEENNVVDIVCDVGLVIGVESNLLSNNIIDQYESRYFPAAAQSKEGPSTPCSLLVGAGQG